MKKAILWTSAAVIAATGLHAQVEIDQSINLTGADGTRKVTNLELPVDGTDAANKDYVDNSVGASGGGGYHPKPLAISDKSSSTMTFSAAIQYCETLSENDQDDWRLPTFDELVYFAGSSADTDYLWTKSRIDYDIATNQNYISARLSDGKWSKGGTLTRFLPRSPTFVSPPMAANQGSGGWITTATITPTVGDAMLLPDFSLEHRSSSSSSHWTTNQARFTLNYADGTSLILGPYGNVNSTTWSVNYAFAARDMEEAWLFGPLLSIVVEQNYQRQSSVIDVTAQARVVMSSASELVFTHGDGNGLYTRCVR